MRVFLLVLLIGVAGVSRAQEGAAPGSIQLWGVTLPRPDVAPAPPFAPPDSGKLLFGLFRILPNNVTHTVVVQPVASPDVTAVVSQASEGTASAVMGNSLLEKSGEEGDTEGTAEGEGESTLQSVSCAMTLSGDQFLPPSGSADTATGTLQIDLTATAVIITIDLTHSIADATSLRMHIGAPGGSGSVTIDLGSPASPIHATHAMTWDELEKASTRAVYFDIHSTAYPGGAVRGAPDCSSAIESPFCRLLLSGDQVVPAAGTDTADGYLMLIGDASNAGFTVHLTHAISGPTAFHLHVGEPGVAGAITVNLGSGESPIDIFHQFSSGELSAIGAGMPAYFDIHTTAYPDGAARGAPQCQTVAVSQAVPENYPPGGTIDVTLTVDKWTSEALTSLAIQSHLPAGWSFNSIVSVDGTLSAAPSACDMTELDFTWGEIPAETPVTLVYRANVPTQYTGAGEQWVTTDGQWATVDEPRPFDPSGTTIEEGSAGSGNDCPVYMLVTLFDGDLGTVTVTSTGIVGSDPPYYYLLGGSAVTLDAAPASGAIDFDGWTGDIVGAALEQTFIVNGDMTANAWFSGAGQYTPGCGMTFLLTLADSQPDPITALGLTIDLPDGWTYEGVNAYTLAPIAISPALHTEGHLEFGWTTIPSPLNSEMILSLQVPEGETGDQTLQYRAIYRTNGPELATATHARTVQPATDSTCLTQTTLRIQPEPEETAPPEEMVMRLFGIHEDIAGAEGDSEPPVTIPACTVCHSADENHDWQIDLNEILRVIQLYNSAGYHCEAGTEDGYAPGPGSEACTAHDSDYNTADRIITLSELLRTIQFFNSCGYHKAKASEISEDTFVPGLGLPIITVNGPDRDWIWLNPAATSDPIYTPPAATAVDGNGNAVDVTVVSSSVDTHTVGTYHMSYQATDVCSNTTTLTRDVVVSNYKERFYYGAPLEPVDRILSGAGQSDPQNTADYFTAMIDSTGTCVAPPALVMFYFGFPISDSSLTIKNDNGVPYLTRAVDNLLDFLNNPNYSNVIPQIGLDLLATLDDADCTGVETQTISIDATGGNFLIGYDNTYDPGTITFIPANPATVAQSIQTALTRVLAGTGIVAACGSRWDPKTIATVYDVTLTGGAGTTYAAVNINASGLTGGYASACTSRHHRAGTAAYTVPVDGLIASQAEDNPAYIALLEHLSTEFRRINDAGRPFFLRIGYEANGNWNHYCPTSYIEAYRRIVKRLRSDGLDFAAVFHAYPPYGYDFRTYYPGDEYVDWAGISVFQKDDLPTATETPITERTNAFMQFAHWHNKPIMICEATPRLWGVAACGDCESNADSSREVFDYIDGPGPQDTNLLVGSTCPGPGPLCPQTGYRRYMECKDHETPNLAWTDFFSLYFELMQKYPGIKATCYINENWTRAGYVPNWHKECRLNASTSVSGQFRTAMADPAFQHMSLNVPEQLIQRSETVAFKDADGNDLLRLLSIGRGNTPASLVQASGNIVQSSPPIGRQALIQSVSDGSTLAEYDYSDGEATVYLRGVIQESATLFPALTDETPIIAADGELLAKFDATGNLLLLGKARLNTCNGTNPFVADPYSSFKAAPPIIALNYAGLVPDVVDLPCYNQLKPILWNNGVCNYGTGTCTGVTPSPNQPDLVEESSIYLDDVSLALAVYSDGTINVPGGKVIHDQEEPTEHEAGRRIVVASTGAADVAAIQASPLGADIPRCNLWLSGTTHEYEQNLEAPIDAGRIFTGTNGDVLGYIDAKGDLHAKGEILEQGLPLSPFPEGKRTPDYLSVGAE